MNIFIAGYYGFGNLGDELLLLKVLKDISNTVKASFFVWTSDPNYTVNFLEKRYPVTPIYRYDSETTIKAIQNSDLVIVGSGGLIQEYNFIDLNYWFTNFGDGLVSYALPALIGKIFKKPVFYWALGHGPLFTTTGKLFATWFYSLADCITLRDALSFSQVKELLVKPQKIFLDTDPLLDPKEDLSSLVGTKPESEEHLLGISLRNWYTTDQLLEALSSSLCRLLTAKKDLRISLISAQPLVDFEVQKKLFSVLPRDRVTLVEEKDPLRIAREILRCRFFVGMRLHGVILSSRAGIPTLLISYDLKTTYFAREYNLPYLEALPQNFSELELALEKLLESDFTPLSITKDYITPTIFRKFISGALNMKHQDLEKEGISINHDHNLAIENLHYQREYYFREMNKFKHLAQSLATERDRLAKELQNAYQEIERQREEIERQKEEISNLLIRLTEIYDSNLWKIAKAYYRLRDRTIFRYIYRLYRPILDRIFKKAN
ncbi:MAG: polysaccharide pyruvyl transferase family protein [Desulfurococcaceae archaeon]